MLNAGFRQLNQLRNPDQKSRYKQTVTFSSDTHFHPTLMDLVPKQQSSSPILPVSIHRPNTCAHSKAMKSEASMFLQPSRQSEHLTASKNIGNVSSVVADTYDCVCGLQGPSNSISTHPVSFKFNIKCTRCGRFSHNTCVG